MNIQEFISNYHNHPVLFVGTGLSLRYLENSYSWDSLLKKVASEFNPDPEYYLDIKAEHMYPLDTLLTRLPHNWKKTLINISKRIVMGNLSILTTFFMQTWKKELISVDSNYIWLTC